MSTYITSIRQLRPKNKSLCDTRSASYCVTPALLVWGQAERLRAVSSQCATSILQSFSVAFNVFFQRFFCWHPVRNRKLRKKKSTRGKNPIYSRHFQMKYSRFYDLFFSFLSQGNKDMSWRRFSDVSLNVFDTFHCNVLGRNIFLQTPRYTLMTFPKEVQNTFLEVFLKKERICIFSIVQEKQKTVSILSFWIFGSKTLDII